MHRDKKVGFALGILLIGIVAAFFFRNEPDPFAELPPLDDPAALDSQIAEKPIGPYTQDLAPAPAQGGSSTVNPWGLPEIYRPDDAQTAPGGTLPISPGAPAPISLQEPTPVQPEPATASVPVGSPFQESPTVGEGTQPGTPLPENGAWTTVSENQTPPGNQPPQQSPPVANSPVPTTPATPASMYQIRRGDTLSVLAEKHLGSSRRYMEIFEANRDKLKDPNDIQIGMQIRIPRRVSFAAGNNASPSPETTFLPTPPEGGAPAQDASGPFTPFSRTP